MADEPEVKPSIADQIKTGRTQILTVRLSSEELARLNARAARLGVKPAALARQAINKESTRED